MAIPKIIGAQRDFSAGELDEAVKRADEQAIMKTGARQLSNFRILQGGQASNRPGRTALFMEPGRVEEVQMSAGNVFFLAFGDRYVRVYNAAGTKVAESFTKGDGSPIPWTTATANSIVFVVVPVAKPQVYVTYGHDAPLNVPLVLTWDGVSQTSTWTIANFAETILGTGQKRTIFDRLSLANVTIQPSGVTGGIVLTASAPIFQPGMAGAHLLWCGREVLLTGYINAVQMYATVLEQLPNAVRVNLGQFLDVGSGNKSFIPGLNGYFLPGDLVEGSISGTRGIVIDSGTTIGIAGTPQAPVFAQVPFIDVQIIPVAGQQPLPYYLATTAGFTSYFLWQEFIVGSNGNSQVGSSGNIQPQAVAVWDDEVMNNFRGWPTSCFYDQNRLGFCGFPASPSGIAWSAIGVPLDFYVNGLATTLNADLPIFERVPGGAKVFFVVPGMENNEFIFCNDAIYYIPISAPQPLTPGSVEFKTLSIQGCQPNVQPKVIQQSILYLRIGGASLGAVQTTGYYARPHIIDNVSSLHAHLLTASPVIALAVPTVSNTFEETYAYALRADGVVLCARFEIKGGLLDTGPENKPKMGWLPWTGAGTVTWISGRGPDLIFTTTYAVFGVSWSNGFSNGFGRDPKTGVSIVELLDNSQYLDMGISVNSAPAPFTVGVGQPFSNGFSNGFGGKGPLWFVAGQLVQLMDLGTRAMSVYQVDPNGNIVPQFNAGENLASAQLVAGQSWTGVLEPFVPDAPPGQDSSQRMNKRRVARMTAYVSNSTGFNMARLFSGPITPTSPALGTQMNFKRITAWNEGDDPTQPPPLRESAYRWRPLGRSFDPRVAIIKDSPGPLLIHEIGYEVSV